MARTKNGTLRLGEDKQGLFFSAQLPNTTAAKDLFEQVRVGNMDECSFAFSVAPGDDDWDDGYDCPDEDCCARGSRGLPRRTIKSLRLFDCSCVSRPAYPQTSISATATYMDVSSADDDDDNGADGAGDPWYQASGVIVSAEARNRAAEHTGTPPRKKPTTLRRSCSGRRFGRPRLVAPVNEFNPAAGRTERRQNPTP